MYFKYFLLKRKPAIALSMWLFIFLLCAFAEAASNSNGSYMYGIFSESLLSITGLRQRFIFYSFYIGMFIYLCIFVHYSISGVRKLDINQSNLPNEHIKLNVVITRYFYLIIYPVLTSTVIMFIYSIFIRPSPRSFGEVLKMVWFK